jgi:malate permease and related proteins
MVETLFQAYLPLIVWVGLGLVSLRFLPESLPRILGRLLYWVGVPWQIFALARYTDLKGDVGLVPIITISTLTFGIILAWSVVQILNQVADRQPELAPGPPETETTRDWPNYNRNQQGSFILAGMLGNTGFVGLGIMPDLISPENMSWAVFFSLTQNLIGTYTIGVLVATHFGGAAKESRWWSLVRNVLFVPSLWAFALGYSTRLVPAPEWLDVVGKGWYYWVIPASFILMGMRLGMMQGWESVQRAIGPVVLKLLLLPLFVALGTTFLGVTGEPRLALVMMSGMPCAFAGLILAEEYDLDRDLAASSIALSTIGLLVMIPVWLVLF